MSGMLRWRPMLAYLAAGSMLAGALLPRTASAEGPTATLMGVLYLADGIAPASGATAIAVNVKTQAVYRSNVTGSNGVYLIEGLPLGTYDVALEVGGTIFVAQRLTNLPVGTTTLSFAAVPDAAAHGDLQGMGTSRTAASSAGTSGRSAPAKRSGRRTFWTAAGWTALAGVLTAALVGGGGGGEPVSPSQP